MLLSIITINYNNKEGLKKTIESVLAQKCKSFEWIVIDGGSTDGSKDVIINHSDNIDFWVSESDSGIYNAMNKGVANSHSEYCLFLNSGDTFHDADVISSIIPQIENERFDFVIGKVLFLPGNYYSDVPDNLTLNWFYKSSIPHPGTFIKTKLLCANPYDESLKIVSDWKFFLQEIILSGASYCHTDVVITDFYCDGISSTNVELINSERKKVLSDSFSDRILSDYNNFKNSSYYYDTDFDKLFMTLSKYRLSRVIYTIDVIILRIISIFRKCYRFVRNYPIVFNRGKNEQS